MTSVWSDVMTTPKMTPRTTSRMTSRTTSSPTSMSRYRKLLFVHPVFHHSEVLLFVLLVTCAESFQESPTRLSRTSFDEVGRCKPSTCHRDADCVTRPNRVYRCRCKPGFYGNGKICIDDNECEYDNGGCSQLCSNVHGNYTCSCYDGFALAKDGHSCTDINECLPQETLSVVRCQQGCINTPGSFECFCRQGFTTAPDGRTCFTAGASNWCNDHLGCSHQCHSTASGTRCACRDGYRLHSNGKSCTAMCSHGNGGCQQKCTDTADGSTTCSCRDRYMLAPDKRTCIPKCAVNNGGCDRLCDDTAQGPRCRCPPGYRLHSDGRTCLDVDECSRLNGGCSHSCQNNVGSYDCTCPPGFAVDSLEGNQCRDINECLSNSTCDHQCINTEGSYQCTCQVGFDLYAGVHCEDREEYSVNSTDRYECSVNNTDRDECSVNNGGCQNSCVNTVGSFLCQCPRGYRLQANQRDCIEEPRSCEPFNPLPKMVITCNDVTAMSSNTTMTSSRVCTFSCRGTAEFVFSGGGKGDEGGMGEGAGGGRLGNRTVTSCGPQTNYVWTHEIQYGGEGLPSCSEQVYAPGYNGRAKFLFFADQCVTKKKSAREVEQQLGSILLERNRRTSGFACDNNSACSVTVTNLKCDSRKRRFRHLGMNNLRTLVSAEFELHVKPTSVTYDCGVDCTREQIVHTLRQSLKRLRSMIDGNHKFSIQYDGKQYEVLKKSLKSFKPRNTCDVGQVLVDKKCVSCSESTYYSLTSGRCERCPAGQFQNKEGQLECISCSLQPLRDGKPYLQECKEQCEAGWYSNDGLKPCRSCPVGQYQPDRGRTVCLQCGSGIRTNVTTGAVSFQQCRVREQCPRGYMYKRELERCVFCPKNTYQPQPGLDYCISCPGRTQTDRVASYSSAHCKSRDCRGNTSGRIGYIESPNWPGYYPPGADCVWKITAEKGRRILVIIPEIDLATSPDLRETCGDSLVMRKSATETSISSFQACNTTTTPLALTARSRTLWIRFKTDEQYHAKGFSIPYVTYSEEYQDLIEDIAQDTDLYQSYRNQLVLKDRQLLSALLEVIEQPYNYFKYAQNSHSMFPESFIHLLRNKVVQFFNDNA